MKKTAASGQILFTQYGDQAFVPGRLPPIIDWSMPLAAALSDADRAITKLSGFAQQEPGANWARSFTRQESVFSARLAGQHIPLWELSALEAGIDPGSVIHNTYQAQNYLNILHDIENDPDPTIDLQDIQQWHTELFKHPGSGNIYAGKFRNTQNRGVNPPDESRAPGYLPPPVKEMHAALKTLESFIRSQTPIPPLMKIGLVHYQLEAIQPFSAGSGRINRLLTQKLMVGSGILHSPILCLSQYFDRHRNEYHKRIEDIQHKAKWGEWLIFFLNGVSAQSINTIRQRGQILQLRDSYTDRLKHHRAAGRLNELVDILTGNPVVTIRLVEEKMMVNFPTAQRYVDRLVEASILREITGRTRNRIYLAAGLLNLFA